MKTKVIIIAIILFSAISIKAQGLEDLLSKGQVAFDSGRYELAIKYLESCEKITSQDTTKETKEIMISLKIGIAGCYFNLNNPAKAIEVSTQALDLCKQVFHDAHPTYALSLSTLAGYYSYLGDNSKAVEYGTQAMNIFKKLLGEDSPVYAYSLYNLANYYYCLSDFAKAIELCTQAKEIQRQILGETHSDYASSLVTLANCYSNMCDFVKAIELCTQAKDIQRQLFGETHPAYASSLSILANCYSNMGNFAKAIELCTQAKDIQRLLLGEINLDYATSLSILANCYSNMGEYSKAVELCTQAKEIRKQLLGEVHPDYATSLSNLALYYSDLCDFAKATELCTQAMEIRKMVLGETHLDYVLSLDHLANYCHGLGYYDKAVELGIQVKKIRKQLLGEAHPDYATSLSNLALYYSDLGDYSKAVALYTRAMEIRKQALGETHPDYATSLSSLAWCYSGLGDFTKAIELCTQAMEIRKQLLGETHPRFGSSLMDLSVFYFDLGDYAKAIELGTQAMEICKQVLGETHPNYATSLGNLAQYYSDLGDYSKAIDLCTQAMEIRKEALGESHPFYASSLGELASYYSGLGDYDKAIELVSQAVSLLKQMLGETHPDYATSLNILANCYSCLGDYSKAVQIGTQTKEIRKQVYGDSHPDYAASLDNLSLYYSDLGDNSKAVELCTQALKIQKQVLGESHPSYAISLSNLATYNYRKGDYGEAYKLQLNCVKHKKEIVLSQFKGTTNRTRETFWDKNKFEFAELPSCCLKAGDMESNGEVYDNSALFAKGLLLNAETSLRDLILESGDSAAVKQFDAMQMIRMTLNKQYEKPIADRKLNCDSLERVAEQMERELMKSSKVFGDFTRNLTVTWEDVQKGLGDDDVAIEFLASPVFGGDSILYVALSLKKGYDKPKMITLFEERDLRMVRESKWYTTPALCELIWGPLADELKGVRNVYFSPSGALYNIGIEQLPCSATENIGERYNMFRLSSTRELALRHDKPSEKSSALYGGLRYYVPPTELLAYNRAKGYSRSSTSRDVFERLPETKTEIDNITALLKAHSYGEPAIYEGDEGTEESFKALSGKRTSIIHLATHGSYITPTVAEKQRKRDMMKRLTFLRAGDDRQSSEEDKALTRSFLVMSGGKMLWTSDSIPEGVDNGLLTAQEISRLDLRGCDLAVLSACETGLGDISSEGVMGLQRGFKKAGVQSIVMSLWKVADRPTQEFMTEFYRHLTAGEGKRTSFLAAQRFLKEKYPTNLPQDEARPPYWASFILLDPEVR